MKIKTLTGTVTEQELETVLRNHDMERGRIGRLKRYYGGRHGILQKAGRTNTAVNNQLVSNYASYIVNVAVGYFLGQPATYKSADEDALTQLMDIYRYNDEQAHNVCLAEEAAITGASYEVLYLDRDAQIRMAFVPSEEIILICAAKLEEEIVTGIRRYFVLSVDGATEREFVDVYNFNSVKHYENKNGTLKQISEEPNFFDDVPIVEYANNRHARGDFEDVISLIDAYNLAQSLTMDDLEDFTDAFLTLRGMGGTTDEDIKMLRRNKVLLLDDGGEASWLTKQINDSYVENVKTRLQRDIHKFSCVPDLSDENFLGNASGVAIKYKLLGLEQIRARKEREFKRGLQRRVELLNNILRLKREKPIDFRDIEVQFTANLPANLQELAQIVTQLDGMLSQETLLSLLPFVTDARAEMAALAKDEQDFI